MRELAGIPLEVSPAAASDAATDHGGTAAGWLTGCHGAGQSIFLMAASAGFVGFMGWKAGKSLGRLSYGRSPIMIAYYSLLWAVSVLNLLWSLFQFWECTPSREFSWNMLSLFTKSGMLFLEISLVAFLLQGNQTTGIDSLTRTFVVSGAIVAADVLLKAIYIFGFSVQLFADVADSDSHTKWTFWIAHKLLLTAVYGLIFSMYHSKWRERLPARPAFYKYICTMLLFSAISFFGSILAGNGAAFGFWLYNVTTLCYHSLYLPLLYVTFLADFFLEEELHLDNVYYSEMKDAGFFDGDWD